MMAKRTFRAILVLIVFGATQIALGALKADFDIQPRLLHVGESAKCTLKVVGAKNPPKPSFPDLEAFDIRYRGTSQQMRMVNFNATRSVVFTYSFIPKKTGKFTIGPYDYKAGSEKAALSAIDIEVVAGNKREGTQQSGGQSLSDMLFARFEIPRDKAYSQEKFPLILKIFAQEGLNVTGNFEPYGFPESGINLGEFRNLGERRRTIDGRIFNVFRFATTARALSSGEYEFEPGLRAELRAERTRRRRDPFGGSFFDSFFDMGKVEKVDVPMDSLKIEIESIPTTNRPPSYSGAVGDFDFNVTAKPRELDAGNPITLTMTVEGQGNMDNITAPELKLGKDFKQYESSLISSDQNGGTGSARKVFEQVVIPKSPDIKELPPIAFSYFDPEKEEFETVSRGPFPLTVHETTNEVVQVSAPSQEDAGKSGPEILGDDIVYLKESSKDGGDWKMFDRTKSIVFWVIQAIPLLMLFGLLVWKRRREYLQVNVAAARRQKAPKVAREALSRADDALQSKDRQAFFEALWESATAYFGNRLNLARGEIDSGQAAHFCREGGIPSDLVERLETILQRCDRERFAAGSTEDLPNDSEDLLTSLREILKRCEKIKSKRGIANIHAVSVLFLASFLAAALCTFANDSDEIRPSRTFAKAAEHYDAGRLDAALRKYRKLIEKGHRSEALYYNIANTYFRQRKFGRAILFYRRAWYLDPNDPDIRANMNLAVSESGAIVPELSVPMRIFTTLSGNEWVHIGVAFYWFSAICVAFTIFSPRGKVGFRRAVYIGLIGLAIAIGGVYCWYSLKSGNEAVVLEDDQEALFAPLDDSTPHFALPEGSIVEVLEESDSWRRIEGAGKNGWLPEDACRLVLPGF